MPGPLQRLDLVCTISLMSLGALLRDRHALRVNVLLGVLRVNANVQFSAVKNVIRHPPMVDHQQPHDRAMSI